MSGEAIKKHLDETLGSEWIKLQKWFNIVGNESKVLYLPSRVKVIQQKIWNEGRTDDGQRGCKAFEDVVCIFNDHGYNQATQSLQMENSVFYSVLNKNTTKKYERVIKQPVARQQCRWLCYIPETSLTVWLLVHRT